MTDGVSLLAAVIADPEDDTVRLVYSDWLEEHGDASQRARAEFIRVQIECEKLGAGDPRQAVLKARERELLEEYLEDWTRPLPEWAQPYLPDHPTWLRWPNLYATDDYPFGFRRGFLQGVVPGDGRDRDLDDDVFVHDVAAISSVEPITHLYVRKAEFMTGVATLPMWLRLAGMQFGHYTLGDEGLVLLSRLPAPPMLRRLWMHKNEIGDRGLRALAKWPGLATVEELELGFNDFHAPGIKALIASPYLTNLKRLGVQESFIAEKTKRALRERFGEVAEM